MDIANAVYDWFNDVVASGLVGQIIAAIVIILLTALVARILSNFLKKVFMREGSIFPMNTIFLNVVRTLVWICGLCVMLSSCFDVDLTAAIAALGIGGIAISLGFQDTISNYVGGLQLSLERIVEPGDFVDVAGTMGVVEDVTWRNTTIKTFDNDTVIIPNMVMNSSKVVKYAPLTMVKFFAQVMIAVKDIDRAAEQMTEQILAHVPGSSPIEGVPVVMFWDMTDKTFIAKIEFEVQEGMGYAEARDLAMRAIAPYVSPQA